ncbi:hypothetical protein FQA39_LY08702 [Lamprigera yunnana]|nr:hypothetical protein FQA39_LY08702 [Lamprigera yunnana]
MKNSKKIKNPQKEKPEIENSRSKNPKYPIQLQHRIWSRFVIVVGAIVYIWYTSKDGQETTLAHQREVLQQRGQAFECDKDYLDEIKNFAGCIPNKCGRYVSDKIVTLNDVETLLKIAKRGFALGGSDGGASILDLHSGALSLGETFVNIYSLDKAKQIFNAPDLVAYRVVKAKIRQAIAEIFQIDVEDLYLTHPTFFSKLTNLNPKTIHDEYWHVHVDKEVYESFHYTSLLYLSDFGKDFENGRLVWLESPNNNVTLEPRKGRVAMFSSGKENTHFVEKVTAGVRYAITISFTCDPEKSIIDPIVL